MQIQKVNSNQNNPNFKGLMIRANSHDFVDASHITRFKFDETLKKTVVKIIGEKSPVVIGSELSMTKIAKIIEDAKKGIVKKGTKLLDGIIDLGGLH